MNNKLASFLNSNERKFLFILVLISIILRTIYVYSIYSTRGTSIFSDDLYYLFLGEQIAAGNWVPQLDGTVSFVAGPTLPLLIATFIKFFNNPIIPFFAYNILITSLMVPVLYFLGKEILNQKTGWILGIWGVFFMETYKYSPHILKETTLFLFVPLTLLFLVRSTKADNSLKNLIWASLSFAWLIHTDERFFIYLPVFVGFFLFTKPLRLKSFTIQTGYWLLFVFLLLVPWSVRNYKVFNQLVILTPRTTAITSKFWGEDISANAAHFSNDVIREKNIEGRYDNAIEFGKQYGISPREYGHNEARLRAFINFWQPTYFKPTYIQYGYRGQLWSFKHNIVSLMFYGLFLPFYIFGMFILLRRKFFLPLFIGTIPVIHSLMHAYMVWPLERYRSPITFIVVIIGVWTILEIVTLIQTRVFQNKISRSSKG